jgi:hypothetical protein
MRRIPIILIFLACTCLSAATLQRPQWSFLGGEVSPLLVNRSDVEQYNSGLRTAENCLVLDVGVVSRRPGSVYVATTRGNAAARLEPFVYNESDAYAMEFTTGKLRFFRGTGQIEASAGVPYDINTPYGADDISALQMYQSADIMYICNRNHMPQKLTRIDHNDWTMADVSIDDGPFRTENTTATTVEVNNTTGTVTMDASANIFDVNHVGALWQLNQFIHQTTITGTFPVTIVEVNDANALPIADGTQYSWSFSCSPTFFGLYGIQVSIDNGVTWTWDMLKLGVAAVNDNF